MDSAVALALKLGGTKITGKCVGVSPSSGKQIVFSQDTVEIHVVPLNKLKIVAPLVRIRTGAIMPATLWGKPFDKCLTNCGYVYRALKFFLGVPDISPMILGTLSDLSVVWSTDQPDVISIIGILSDAGQLDVIFLSIIVTFILI